MPKSTFFTGQPIFSQLLSFIPRALVNQLVRKHKTDHYCKKFKSFDHLVSMLFCGFHQCSSLRELVTGLQANSHRLNHMGLLHTPRRSTLADANKRRTALFFEDLFHGLYKHHYGTLPDSRLNGKLYDKVFVIDSTTITLFCDVLKGAGVYGFNGKKKGGVKAHVLTRIKDQVPCFVHLTPSSRSDRIFMPMIDLPPGSVVCMDKAYVNYKVMNAWTNNHISWVTRLAGRLKYEILEDKSVTEHHQKKGVRSD
ncbi:MAG: IS4 family transposase, partial [Acidobacteriota bacterium]